MSEWALAGGVVLSGFSLMIAYWLGYRAGVKSEMLAGQIEFSEKILRYQGTAEKIRDKYDALLHRSVSGTLTADALGQLLSQWQASDDAAAGKAKP